MYVIDLRFSQKSGTRRKEPRQLLLDLSASSVFMSGRSKPNGSIFFNNHCMCLSAAEQARTTFYDR